MTGYPLQRAMTALRWDGSRFVSVSWWERYTLLRRRRRLRPEWGDDEMALMRRNTVRQDGSAGQQFGMELPDEMQGCPTAWDFLTMTTWPDTKKPRALGSVLFFVDGAGLKCRLMDNDCEQCAFGVIDTSQGIWAGVEAMLLSTSTDWRAQAKGGQGKRK